MVLNLQFLIILKLGFNTATNSQTVIELEKILKDNMKSCRTYITAAFFFYHGFCLSYSITPRDLVEWT